jgi:serine/threonine protein phosphatase PrpC
MKLRKEEIGDKENMKPNNINYTASYDQRLMRKPPNPGSSAKQVKVSNFLKKPSSSSMADQRKMNVSVERKQEKEHSMVEDEESEKRIKIQKQILEHLKTGSLPQNSIITPILSNDGQVRQYILNDPIANPDEIEVNIPLLPGERITNTTVDRSKCSTRRNGIVKAYAANTNKGIIRNYNEDRVSIILNILKPNGRKGEEWPKWSFFGVFDGHGGAACADFLRDNLHQFVIKDPSFPNKPEEALRQGFATAEKVFLQNSEKDGDIIEKSGSWAIVILIVGQECYVVNVGDSRAVLSYESGRKAAPLSTDHKPSDTSERTRIQEGGGQIYQTATVAAVPGELNQMPEIIIGPMRVFPGRLSVSRTFGDIEAKLPSKGGNPNVVSSTPEIRSFKLSKSHDFVILGCDGIFDKLNDRECVDWVWNSVYQNPHLDVHQVLGLGAETIMKNSLYRRSLDNVTVVIIAFSGFKDKIASLNEQVAKNQETMAKNESMRGANYQMTSKSQRSASQNKVIGGTHGFLNHNTLM